jgi:hypothetical protein
MEKLKLIFSVFYPHGSKEKISGSDFEIRATNFKIQGTYFLLSENPFENRGKIED